MPNIKFNYLYRDGGNYKKYNSVIFANPDDIVLFDFKIFVESKLIDETWFYAKEWNLPELFPDTFDPNCDPTWHEFDSVEYIDEPAGEGHIISAFRNQLNLTLRFLIPRKQLSSIFKSTKEYFF